MNSGVAKLDIRWRLDGRSLRTLENLVKTSGRPSRYQSGERRYIGGASSNIRSGREVAEALKMDRTSSRMGSTRKPTEPPVSSDLVRKLVTQDTMHTLDSARTDLRHSASKASLPQGRTWQEDIGGRSRQFVGFMCLWTLESPTMLKQRDTDIVGHNFTLTTTRGTQD